MTLSEQLDLIMKTKNLTNNDIRKLTGVMPWEISLMRNGGDFRPNALKTMAEKLDAPELEQYIKHKICPCGEKFIPDRNHRCYHSDECREKFKTNKTGAIKKAEMSFVEYNERARSQGLTYGQLQGLERLGLR